MRGHLRVLQVVAGLDPAHGGPSYSVPRLCSGLTDAGADVSLFSIGRNGDPIAPEAPAGFPVLTFPQSYGRTPWLRSLRLSRPLRAALRREAARFDVIHNHGIWLAPNIQAQWSAREAGAPFVCSPRGMLSREALAFSSWRKRVVWLLAQEAALRNAACLHATSEGELADIRICGLRAPVAVVPNGVDVPDLSPRSEGDGSRTLLSLGRLHPKKGLDVLLQAWSRVQDHHPAWRLRLVGPAERDQDKVLLALASQLGLERFSLEGPVYGARKTALYQQAELFVLATRNENFGLTVAEALAAGTPVICSKGAPWPQLEARGCGWWTDHGAEPLAAALDVAMSSAPTELEAMGRRGREWMIQQYSWARAAADMMQVYRWLSSGGERPGFVWLN